MSQHSDAAVLVDQIYAAALDDSRWSPVMNQLADLVGGGPSAFVRKDLLSGQGRGIFSRIDTPAFDSYFGYFAQRNPLAADLAARAAGSILIDWQTVPKAEFMQSEYYNDFMRPRGLHGVLGLVLWRDQTDGAVLNLIRSPRQGDFQPSDAARLVPFMPHLRRAVAFSRQLPPRPPAVAELDPIIETWHEALLLLDPLGRLRYANRAAERILARQDGLSAPQGRLTARDTATARRLQAAIHAAGAPDAPASGSTLIVPRGLDRRPYVVLVVPARRESSFLGVQTPHVVVTVVDLDASLRPEPSLLTEVFGLSRAQASVATMLADGHDPKEIAQTLGLSHHTVRRHLADVMQRTETNRQAELVRLVMRLPRRAAPLPPLPAGGTAARTTRPAANAAITV